MSLFSSTLAGQVVKNSLSILLRGGAQAAFIILVTPIVLRRLGASDFGIWSLIYVFIAYAALFDFGVSGALARYLGAVDAAHDPATIKQLLSAASAIISLLCFVALCGWFVVGGWCFRGTMGGHSTARLLLLAGFLFVASMFSNLLMYALLGIQRQDLGSYVSACYTVLSGVGAVILLWLGIRLEGLILFSACATLVMGVVSCIVFFRQVPESPSVRIDWGDARKLLFFGGRLQLYALAGIFYQYFGKIVVAYACSLAAVAQYELALRLVTQLRQGFSAMATPLMPATARLHVEGKAGDVGRYFFFAVKFVSLLSLPVFAGFCFFASTLMSCWVGNGYEESARVLRILAPGFYASTLSGVTWFFLVGRGTPGVGGALSLGETAFGVIGTLLLAARYGLNGAALGATLAAWISLPLYFWLYHRRVWYESWRLFREAFASPLIVCVLLALPAYVLLRLPVARLAQLACILAYIFACYGVFLTCRIVSHSEQESVRLWFSAQWRARMVGSGP